MNVNGVNSNFKPFIIDGIMNSVELSNERISKRVADHILFVRDREERKGALKHVSDVYNFSVMTNQEKKLSFATVKELNNEDGVITATYTPLEFEYIRDNGSADEKDKKEPKQKKTKQMTL